MGLNLSNRHIAQELDLDEDDVQAMTGQLRQGIVDSKPEVQLSGDVEWVLLQNMRSHKDS